MEFIYVPHVFHDPAVEASLTIVIKFDDSTVVYSLSNPIRFKRFNFNNFFSNIDVKDFIQDNTILPCNYAGSGFIDNDHRNIVTGDLRNVGNNKLRK